MTRRQFQHQNSSNSNGNANAIFNNQNLADKKLTFSRLNSLVLGFVNLLLALKSLSNLAAFYYESNVLVVEYNGLSLLNPKFKWTLILLNSSLFLASILCLVALSLPIDAKNKSRLFKYYCLMQMTLAILVLLAMGRLWFAPMKVKLNPTEWRNFMRFYSYEQSIMSKSQLRWTQPYASQNADADYDDYTNVINERHRYPGHRILPDAESRGGHIGQRDSIVTGARKKSVHRDQPEGLPVQSVWLAYDKLQEALQCCGRESSAEWSQFNQQYGLMAPTCCSRPLSITLLAGVGAANVENNKRQWPEVMMDLSVAGYDEHSFELAATNDVERRRRRRRRRSAEMVSVDTYGGRLNEDKNATIAAVAHNLERVVQFQDQWRQRHQQQGRQPQQLQWQAPAAGQPQGFRIRSLASSQSQQHHHQQQQPVVGDLWAKYEPGETQFGFSDRARGYRYNNHRHHEPSDAATNDHQQRWPPLAEAPPMWQPISGGVDLVGGGLSYDFPSKTNDATTQPPPPPPPTTTTDAATSIVAHRRVQISYCPSASVTDPATENYHPPRNATISVRMGCQRVLDERDTRFMFTLRLRLLVLLAILLLTIVQSQPLTQLSHHPSSHLSASRFLQTHLEGDRTSNGGVIGPTPPPPPPPPLIGGQMSSWRREMRRRQRQRNQQAMALALAPRGTLVERGQATAPQFPTEPPAYESSMRGSNHVLIEPKTPRMQQTGSW